ncbi:MAG TPA: hypothetical protein VEK15_31665 [Vicinamibacteria bacterium]|nr:hypothetical protein [Vicinamibacteria bacterium]
MHDALVLRLLDLLGDRERFVDRNRPAPQMLREVHVLDELHREEMRGGAVFERRALESELVGDVGMVERREKLRLALEASEPLSVLGERRRQHLDGDVAAERRVRRSVHLAHAACAEPFGDSIM